MSTPSRYAAVGTATWTAPDGTAVPYLLRRFLPQAGQLAIVRAYRVRAGDRVDLLANAELGDPELSWLLADANPVQRPSDLAQTGQVVLIPLPSGAAPSVPSNTASSTNGQ